MDTLTSINEKLLYLLQSLQLDEKENLRIKQCIASEDYSTALVLLRRKRGEILEKLHARQQVLDNLDLLVYQIKKWKNERMETK